MKRPKKQGSRRRMTPLERGLAVSGRRNGMTWDEIAECLRRDPSTLRSAVKRHKELFRNVQTIRKEIFA